MAEVTVCLQGRCTSNIGKGLSFLGQQILVLRATGGLDFGRARASIRPG